jgi:glycosyltransferase involved in cell wall biosynthesis
MATPRRRVVMVTTDVRVDRRILQEAGSLARHGWEVIVLAAGCEPPPPAGVSLRPVALGGQARRTMLRIRGALSGLSVLERAYAAVVDQLAPAVVHVHDLPLLAVGVRAAKRGARLVYDMHELYPEIGGLDPAVRRRLDERERALIGPASLCFTVNPLLAEEISRRYGIAVHVIENAVETSQYPPATTTSPLRRNDDRRLFLFQGWLSQDRNLETLVKGFAQSSGLEDLVLVGYGEYRVELERLAAKEGATDRIRFAAAVRPEELAVLTSGADVGVIPYSPGTDLNTRLCSPNKLYEFAAAGVPVLANRGLEFVQSLIAEWRCGLIASLETPDEVATALRTFPYDRIHEFRTHLAEQRDRFTWEHQERALLDLYSRLAAA